MSTENANNGVETCATCMRLRQFQNDCAKSIQQLTELLQAARAAHDVAGEDRLLKSLRSLEAEARQLARALADHVSADHRGRYETG